VVLTLLPVGIGVIAYIVAWIIIPEELEARGWDCIGDAGMIIQPSGISVHIQDRTFPWVEKQIFLISFAQYTSQAFFPKKR
jgi:hypothetical protein